MSYVLNNVGPGLNIVVINDEQERHNFSTKVGKKTVSAETFH